MELTYPLLLYIGAGLAIVAFIATLFVRKAKYKGGRRSANTELVKEIPQYKLLLIEYGFLKFITVLAIVGSIIMSLFLVSKPAEVRTVTTEKHNRDIFICFDVSASLDAVSTELCDKMKDFVSELKGERFGISIFNGQSVVLVPLTDDYNFVIDEFDRLKASIEAGRDVWYYSDLDEISGYRYSGTDSEYGSSIIGDGLASCLYSFPDLDEEPDRSRLIIFVTDNDVAGTEQISVPRACELCAYRGVKVFALSPEFVANERTFQSSVESTGGKYYNTRDRNAMRNMIEEVGKTDVSATYTSVTTVVDVPEVATVILIICAAIYTACTWRLKL